jgi:hypothetical protein
MAQNFQWIPMGNHGKYWYISAMKWCGSTATPVPQNDTMVHNKLPSMAVVHIVVIHVN